MSIRDDSELALEERLSQQMEQVHLDARNRIGQKPTESESREARISQFMEQHNSTVIKPHQSDLGSRATFLPSAYPACVTPHDKLQRILLEDLIFGIHNLETYIALRSITPSDEAGTATYVLAEDETGRIIYLVL